MAFPRTPTIGRIPTLIGVDLVGKPVGSLLSATCTVLELRSTESVEVVVVVVPDDEACLSLSTS